MAMDERFQALELAHKLLDQPNCDPDDDLRVLSRQLIRKHEHLAKLQRYIVILESELDRETLKRCIAIRDRQQDSATDKP